MLESVILYTGTQTVTVHDCTLISEVIKDLCSYVSTQRASPEEGDGGLAMYIPFEQNTGEARGVPSRV
jgi:hypothetical protein